MKNFHKLFTLTTIIFTLLIIAFCLHILPFHCIYHCVCIIVYACLCYACASLCYVCASLCYLYASHCVSSSLGVCVLVECKYAYASVNLCVLHVLAHKITILSVTLLMLIERIEYFKDFYLFSKSLMLNHYDMMIQTTLCCYHAVAEGQKRNQIHTMYILI